jgi:hypothetical protein
VEEVDAIVPEVGEAWVGRRLDRLGQGILEPEVVAGVDLFSDFYRDGKIELQLFARGRRTLEIL